MRLIWDFHTVVKCTVGCEMHWSRSVTADSGTQLVKSYGWQPLELLHGWELVWIQHGYPIPFFTMSYKASWLNLQCFPSTCTHQSHWMASCWNFRLLLQITSSFCTTSFKQTMSVTTRGEVLLCPKSLLLPWLRGFPVFCNWQFGIKVWLCLCCFSNFKVTFPVSSFKLKSNTAPFLVNISVYRSLGFNLDLGKILCVCFPAVRMRGDWQFPRFSEAISLALRGRERIVWRRKETKNSTLCHVWWLVCSVTFYWHERERRYLKVPAFLLSDCMDC